MSRSYYEWVAARDAWRREHNLKISSFPYPSRDSIVYQRASNNAFWERRREQTENLIPASTLSFSAQQTFDFISQAAVHERAKEEEFLNKFFPNGEMRNGTITDQFNILFQSRERYERVLEHIAAAKKKAQNGWKGTAPNFEALYASYLNTRLNKVLADFRASFTVNTDFAILEAKFKQLIDEAIIETSNDIAAITTEDEVYGSGEDWKEIAHMLNSDEYLRNEFIGNIRNAIGNENIDAVLKEMYKEKGEKGKKKKTSTIVREAMHLSARTAYIGGNVIENTYAALAQYLGGLRGGNGSISYSVDATAVHGQKVVTDSIMMFSAEAEVNTTAAARRLNEILSDYQGPQEKAYQAIEQFYREQEKAMHELYTVFVNSKNYQMGGNYGVYRQHHDGTLNELDDFLTRVGINVGNIDEFLLSAYNTAEGAINYGKRGQIYEGAINALKAAAVKFMFDDWQSVGSGGQNSIHMFLLSGKYVPSSVVFDAMARAGESSVDSRANIVIPKINDPGPEGWSGGTDVEVKQAILDHWNDEYARISAGARWTADFVINVKRAIGL